MSATDVIRKYVAPGMDKFDSALEAAKRQGAALQNLVDKSWNGLNCRYCGARNVGDGSPEIHFDICPIPEARAALADGGDDGNE